tara:strand:+ start:1331 stop:2359 length:1029 start_codon:yes stop_codon:yes gene_type:complete
MIIGGKHFKDITNIKNGNKDKLHKYLYINGREAFASILNKIKKKEIQNIYIPNYICTSLLDVISRYKLKKIFYEVDNNLEFTVPNVKNSIILIINYFGKKKIISKDILKKNIIIEDTTLSVTESKNKIGKTKKNHYFFGSYRKVFTSLFCGYSSIKNKHENKKNPEIELLYLNNLAASYLRKNYLNNDHYTKSRSIEKIYLKIFNKLETFFDKNLLNYGVNQIFLNYFTNININKEIYIRQKHYKLLEYALKNNINDSFINNKKFSFFIFLSKKKQKLISYLSDYNIYLTYYWKRPRIFKKKKISHNLYENLIYLPTDSIYSHKEVKFMLKKINLFIKKYGI